MAPYEALYGRRCRSPIGLFEVGDPLLLDPDIVYKTLEKFNILKNWLQKAYSPQKSLAYNLRRDL